MTDIAMVLSRIGAKLRDEIGPALGGHYLAGTTGMTGMLAIMAGEAYDGAADRLVNDIDAIVELLQAGGIDPGDAVAASLKVSDLKIVHDRLAAALIELQAALEASDKDEDKALNARIWGFLLQSASARMPSLPQMSAPDD